MARREFGGHRSRLDQVRGGGATVAANGGRAAAEAATARLVRDLPEQSTQDAGERCRSGGPVPQIPAMADERTAALGG